MKKPKNLKLKVFFNASVILAGLHSPRGGSARILNWVKTGKIEGIISEVIFDEVMRRCPKVGLTPKLAAKLIVPIFKIISAPPVESVNKYSGIVADLGDSHVLAGAKESDCRFLVSLDKKHLLVLSKKIRRFQIVSSGGLIEAIK